MRRPTLARLATGTFLLLVGCEAALTIAGSDGTGAADSADAATPGETDGRATAVDGALQPSDAAEPSEPRPELLITCGDAGLELDPTFGDGGVAEAPVLNSFQVTQLLPHHVIQRLDGTYVVAANDFFGNARSTLLYDSDGRLVGGVHPPFNPGGGGSRCFPAFGLYQVTESGRVAGFGAARAAMISDAGDAGAVHFRWEEGTSTESMVSRVVELPNERLLAAGSVVDSGALWCSQTVFQRGEVYVGLLETNGTLTWKTKLTRYRGFGTTFASSIVVRDEQISVLIDGVGIARLSMSGDLLWTASSATGAIVALDDGRVATSEGTILADGGTEMRWDASIGPPRFVDDAGSVYFGSPPGLLHRRFADGGEDTTYASAPVTRLNLTEGAVWKGCTVTRADGRFMSDAGRLRRYRY